jgi:HK97 gp10 family phage protein
MTGGGAIELEGLDKLLKALEKCDRDVVEAALVGLEAGGQEIINDAIRNIQHDNIWTTGLLAQSGHVIRKKDDITAGFFDTTNRTGYAEYVEYGRRAGKMPPPDEIGAWVYKKFHLKDWKTATSLGWAIAKRIAQEGTQPHPFFGPAVKKNHNSIIKAMRDAVRRKTK